MRYFQLTAVALSACAVDQLTKLTAQSACRDSLVSVRKSLSTDASPTCVVLATIEFDRVIKLPGAWIQASVTHVENRGIIFGILENTEPWVTTAAFYTASVTGLAATVMAYHFVEKNEKHSSLLLSTATWLSASFIVAGIVGNGLDRMGWGYVEDWLHLQFGSTALSYSAPVFNLADVFLVLGILSAIVVGTMRTTTNATFVRSGLKRCCFDIIKFRKRGL